MCLVTHRPAELFFTMQALVRLFLGVPAPVPCQIVAAFEGRRALFAAVRFLVGMRKEVRPVIVATHKDFFAFWAGVRVLWFWIVPQFFEHAGKD